MCAYLFAHITILRVLYVQVGSPRHRISTEATFPPHDDKTSDNSEGNKNNGRVSLDAMMDA